MNQEDLVLKDIDLCRKVSPILERLGIKPDGYWSSEKSNKFLLTNEDRLRLSANELNYNTTRFVVPAGTYDIKTYRQDKLVLGLPDWCFQFGRLMQTISFTYDLPPEIDPATFDDYMFELVKERGQKQLELTAQLLILLEENGLGKKEI